MSYITSRPLLRQFVLETLADIRLREIDFRLEGFPRVHWGLFDRVRQAVRDCRIEVAIPVEDSQGEKVRSPASYSRSNNHFKLRINAPGGISTSTISAAALPLDNKAFVAHEAVHAGFDMERITCTQNNDEVCGYLVEDWMMHLLKPNLPISSLGRGRLLTEALAYHEARKNESKSKGWSFSCSHRQPDTFFINRNGRNYNLAKTQIRQDHERSLVESKAFIGYNESIKDFGVRHKRDGVPAIGHCAP